MSFPSNIGPIASMFPSLMSPPSFYPKNRPTNQGLNLMTLAGMGENTPYGMPADPYQPFGKNPVNCFPARTLPQSSSTYPLPGGGMGQDSLGKLLIPILQIVLQLVQKILGNQNTPVGNARENGLYGQWKESSYQPPIPPEMPYVDPGMPYDETGSSAGSDSSADSDGASAQAEAEAAAAAQRQAQAQASRSKIDAAKAGMIYVEGQGLVSASSFNTDALWRDAQGNVVYIKDKHGNDVLGKIYEQIGSNHYRLTKRPPGAVLPPRQKH